MALFTVRLARPDDLDDIAAIDAALGRPQDMRDRADMAAAVAQRRALVCDSPEGGAWGYATWTMLWERHPFVQFIRVHPARRRVGAGRALMEALIARFAADGHHWMASSTDQDNTAALAFHVTLGFQRAGDVRLTDAEEVEVMFRRRLH